jgi:hypothetical protein
MDPVDHPVNGIVADVRVQLLNEWMQLNGAERPIRKEEEDRIRKDRLRGPAAGPPTQ